MRQNSRSINQALYDSIECTFEEDGYSDDYARKKFRVRVSYGAESITANFFMSSKEKPENAKHLFVRAVQDECSHIENTADLEEWAYELAYDLEADREKVEALYEKCLKQYEEWQQLLGDNFRHFVFPAEFEPNLDELPGAEARLCP